MSKRVAILGAGITGMAAAYKLAENGGNVIVIEKEPRVGGLAGSILRNGAIFDFGAHAFVLDDDMKKEFIRLIDEKDLNIFKKNAKIKFGDKYYQYPLDAIDILLKSDPIMTLSCLFDYIIAKIRMKIGSPEDDSAESWIINRFGKSLYKIYFEKYTEKVWGIHPKFIAPSFTEERIPLLNLRATIKTTVKKALRRLLKKEKATEPSYLTQLYYPKKGLVFFFEQLVSKINSNNGMICLNSQLSDIQLDGHRVKTISFKKDGDIKTIGCDYVISTIPINELIKRITPKPDTLILNAANSLRFRALTFVNLIVKKQEVFDVQWIYFRNRIFNRVSEMTKFSKELFPHGLTGLCAEITCDKGDEIWNANEEELCHRVMNELEEEGLITRQDVVDVFVTRKEHGYPVADLNYERNRKLLYDYIRSIENLFITGRQGLFRYLQMDHCMKMGFAVAEHILAGKCEKYKSNDKDTYFI